jgi:type IX secretion system PorP/SprF family membrane protein
MLNQFTFSLLGIVINRQLTLLYLILGFLYNRGFSQNHTFSQFFTVPTVLNPAYVSVGKGIEINSGYRKQYGGIQQGLTQKSIQASVASCKTQWSYGGYFSQISEPYFGYRKSEGGFQTGLFVPFRKSRSLSAYGVPYSIHFGLQAGFGSESVQFQKLVFTGQLDPVFGSQTAPPVFYQNDGESLRSFELGGGAVWRGEIPQGNNGWPASFGFSVFHLGGNNQTALRGNEVKQQRRYAIHGSVTTPVKQQIGEVTVFYLNWLARFESQSKLRRTSLGLISQFDEVNLGLVYHWNVIPVTNRDTKGLSGSIGFKHNRFSVQYAIDASLGGLGYDASRGGHEITFALTLSDAFLLKPKDKRGRTDCYSFDGKKYRRFLN